MKWFKKTNSLNNKDAELDLTNWWKTTFTKAERDYMVSHFPSAVDDHNKKFEDYLNENSNEEAYRFLSGISSWFRDKEHATILERIQKKIVDISKKYPLTGPGFYGGRHYTTYVDDINKLKKSGPTEELEELLLNILETVEYLSTKEKMGVPPWYYNELAVLYRKTKSYDKEVAVLERYSTQQHAPGVMPVQLQERLEKARELKAKHNM